MTPFHYNTINNYNNRSKFINNNIICNSNHYNNNIPYYVPNLFEYLKAILPIVIAHIAIPPLSYLNHKENIPEVLFSVLSFIYYNLIPKEWLDYNFVIKLAHRNVNEWKDIHIPGLFTHIFVHGNYQHMLKNLLAALQFGYPVYARCGHLGLYGLFLTGGALAVLPSPLHNKSKENFKQIVKQSSDSIKNKYGLPDFIANPLESLMTGAGDVAASLLLPSLGVGSSGSICCFIGFEMFNICKYLYNKIKQKKKENTNINDFILSLLNEREFKAKTIDFCASVLYLISEYKRISPLSYNDSQSKSLKDKFMLTVEESRIDHAAHVQGTLFGILFAILVEIFYLR